MNPWSLPGFHNHNTLIIQTAEIVSQEVSLS